MSDDHRTSMATDGETRCRKSTQRQRVLRYEVVEIPRIKKVRRHTVEKPRNKLHYHLLCTSVFVL